jgi:hypothetical protein
VSKVKIDRVTQLVPHVEQELPTLPKHLSSPLVFSGVRVASILCNVFVWIVVCPFSFSYCSEMGSNIVLDKDKAKARAKQLKTLQLLFLLLPSDNYLLLECLIDLLHKVTKSSGNMMTAQSLGTLFAPHLLCCK